MKTSTRITVSVNYASDSWRLMSQMVRQGFTLVELIVTLSIMGIITAMVTPVILTKLADMEAKSIRYTLVNTLKLAKAESFVRRKDLIMCLSDNGGICHKDSSKSLLLFIDNDDNKNFEDGTDTLVHMQVLNPKYALLKLRAGGRHYVRFAGDSGKPRGFFGHIKYCPSVHFNAAQYQISFSQGGMITYKPNASYPTECDN